MQSQTLQSRIASFFANNKELLLLSKIFILFFLISFNYNLLRPLKVSVVVTGSSSGASVIPFLKFWVNLPISIFFAYMCVKLGHYYSRLRVFMILLSIFMVTFALFAVLFPHSKVFALDTIANWLQQVLPTQFAGFISMIQNWHLALFYVMAELWGIIMLTVLSWGLVNECISFNYAKKYYAILAAGADSAGIFSGQIAQKLHFKAFNPNFILGNTAWEQSVSLTLLVTLVLGCLIALIYRSIYFTADKHFLTKDAEVHDEKPAKPSLISSIKTCLGSKYLMSMAVMVVSYYVVFNTFEVVWTENLRRYFDDPVAFNKYLNQLVSMTGILAACTALIFSRKIILSFGWIVGALATPITLVCTALAFYACYLMLPHDLTLAISAMPVMLMIGSVAYCCGRATKYTIFDATKEMAFIPLPKTTQRQSKIVIDAIASRLGKSGSAIFLQLVILFSGGLLASVPLVAAFTVMILGSWIFAVKKLDSLLHITLELQRKEKQKEIPLAAVS